MKSFRRVSGMGVLVSLALAALLILIVAPLLIELVTSLRGPFLPFGVPTAEWGLGNYHTLWGLRRDFLATLWATVGFVGGSTVIATLIAGCLAWLVARTDLPGRNLITILVVVPYVIPPIVRAQAFYLMLAPKTGLFNQLLRQLPFFGGETGPIDPFSFLSITMVQALSNVTFPFLLMLPILQFMDGSLEEASRVSGASWAQTIRRVTIPVLGPAITGVMVLSAILNLGSLEIPLLFGQQSGRHIFALKLWNLISSDVGELPQYGLAAAYSIVFLAFTSVLFWVYRRATRDADRRASVTGKGFRPQRLTLGRMRWPSLVGVWGFLVVTALLPLISLIWQACTAYPMPITWDNLLHRTRLSSFGAVLQDPEFWASLTRTLTIAVCAASIAVVTATILAYAAARGRPGWRTSLLDTVASASLAIPAAIAGFSFFILVLVTNPYIALNGTLLSLIVAYSYRISVSYRTSYSATLQIKRELEEAAATSGASRFTTFRWIVLPLLLPAMFAVWIQMFILSANEFTLPAFLATPQNQPLSTYLYSQINPGEATLYAPDRGAAMALIFTFLVMVIGYGLQWALSKRSLMQAQARSGDGAPDPDEDPAQEPDLVRELEAPGLLR